MKTKIFLTLILIVNLSFAQVQIDTSKIDKQIKLIENILDQQDSKIDEAEQNVRNAKSIAYDLRTEQMAYINERQKLIDAKKKKELKKQN